MSLYKFNDGDTSANDTDLMLEIRNGAVVDDTTLFKVWSSSLHGRRLAIRNKTTVEVMAQYPEYSKPALVWHTEWRFFTSGRFVSH